MKDFTYLFIDFFAVIVPLIFSFHPRINFYRRWRSFMPALGITAILFVLWDIWFTSTGIWNFNPEYITGIKIFNLPIEEILFFICIPYACLFTYYCISLWRKKQRSAATATSGSFILFLISTAVYFHDRLYTVVTFSTLAVLILFVSFIKRAMWMRNFYLAGSILLIPFIICNGLLTGSWIPEAVVRYNDNENMGIRILTIPLEDMFYGMLLILMNVSLFEYAEKNNSQPRNHTTRNP